MFYGIFLGGKIVVEKSYDEKTHLKKEIFEWGKAILIAIILTFIIRTFLFAPFQVDGDSMLPNFTHKERLIANEIIYDITSPKRGDVIIFHFDEQRDYIKRIIGVPGDTIEMKSDQLYVNGEPIDEPYLTSVKNDLHNLGMVLTEDFGPITVEEKHLFVLGDNRKNSKDSRMIGQISFEQVVGRADVVFWPLNSFRIIK